MASSVCAPQRAATLASPVASMITFARIAHGPEGVSTTSPTARVPSMIGCEAAAFSSRRTLFSFIICCQT